MAKEYRQRIAELPDGVERALEEARLRILERVAQSETEGAPSARSWWEAMTDVNALLAREEFQSA